MYTSVKFSHINRLNKCYQSLLREAGLQEEGNPKVYTMIIEKAEFLAQSIRRLCRE
ncbi:MAG: hypothetical protein OEW75_03380 [Cyclobacteriaceae bacterium]|nr:hypothetical protein [Cyclobacteriaceae bacterium]